MPTRRKLGIIVDFPNHIVKIAERQPDIVEIPARHRCSAIKVPGPLELPKWEENIAEKSHRYLG